MNRYDTPLEDAVRVCTAELRATIHELREDLADASSEIERLKGYGSLDIDKLVSDRNTAIENLEEMRDKLTIVPELNMNNYDYEDVVALNNGMIEQFNDVNAALSAIKGDNNDG